ncbi:putative T7SS-secreted protein [Pseudonocardia sp. GCM10023141]|uniref:putative T7SS-secreted protein n=1 Tax=Pseudonocardia sp. GCM10023141 TaxID=3252653 RepID=UPI0036238FA5
MATESTLEDTDDPRALVHGDPERIASTSSHLGRLGEAFGHTASGLQRIDLGAWQGVAADAFRSTFQDSPARWSDAATAFRAAAASLNGFHGTLSWAQSQAGEAAALYRQGRAASVAARSNYNEQVDAYNAAAAAGTSATAPPPFTDPGGPAMARAQQILDDARYTRDAAGADTARALTAATTTAPPLPSGWERLGSNLADGFTSQLTETEHLLGGVGEGIEGLAKLLRSVNPVDPYNLTHPARYVDNVSTVAAGLVHTVVHPVQLVKDVVGTGWGSDPAKATGHLIPNLLLGLVPGGSAARGAGAAARDAAVTAERGAAARGGEAGLAHPPAPAAPPIEPRPAEPAPPAAAEPHPAEPAVAPVTEPVRPPEPAPHSAAPEPAVAPPPELRQADVSAAHTVQASGQGLGAVERAIDPLRVHEAGVLPARTAVGETAPVSRAPVIHGSGPIDGQIAPAAGAASSGSPVAAADPAAWAVPPPLRRAQPFLEKRELDIRFKGEHDGTGGPFLPDLVEYFSPLRLEDARLTIEGGQIRWATTGELFDTSTTMLWDGPSDKAMFVMDEHGNLYSSLEQEKGRWHHSSFLSGGPVASAGEIESIQGVPQAITRRSGHYQPGIEHLEQVANMLRERGVDITKIDWSDGF